MKQEQVIEIASQANIPYSFVEAWLDCFEAFADEIERRTLERAAVVCAETDKEYRYYDGDQHDDAGVTLQQAARAIRALKDQS